MTAPHISDELPRMLTGEADRDTVMAAATHLRDCVDCQQELVSALVAHASLSSARRFAPEIVTGTTAALFSDAATAASIGEDPDGSAVEFPAPVPFRPSMAPLSELDLNAARHAAQDSDLPDFPARSDALPDLSAVFAQVRAEADAGASRESGTVVPLQSRRRTRYLVGAAAAAVIVGAAGVVYGVTSTDNSTGPAPQAGRTVQLAAYGVGKSTATAKVGSGSMSIDAASLPKLAGKRYEVWLTNSRRTAMQPVGWIGSDGKAVITVPNDLITKYSDVEVSMQDLAADSYSYSGVSVLRGALT